MNNRKRPSPTYVSEERFFDDLILGHCFHPTAHLRILRAFGAISALEVRRNYYLADTTGEKRCMPTMNRGIIRQQRFEKLLFYSTIVNPVLDAKIPRTVTVAVIGNTAKVVHPPEVFTHSEYGEDVFWFFDVSGGHLYALLIV